MSQYILSSGKVVNGIHIMADGSVRDSVKDYEVPYNETTANVYRMLVDSIVQSKNKLN